MDDRLERRFDMNLSSGLAKLKNRLVGVRAVHNLLEPFPNLKCAFRSRPKARTR